jgi:O-antigen/teichoic acid export membrane protein
LSFAGTGQTKHENLFLSKSFIGDTLISLGGTGLARLTAFGSMAAITRIYAPDVYGTWVILLAVAGFFLPFATLRYDIALVLAPTRRIAAALFVAVAALTALMSALVLASVLAVPGWVLEIVTGFRPDQSGWLVLVPVVLVLLSCHLMLQSWLTRERQFGALSTTQIVQSMVTAAAILLLPLAVGANAGAVAGGAIMGLVSAIFCMAWCARPQLFEAVSRRRLDVPARHGLRRYKVYPLYTVPYSLSASLSERILQIVLAGSYSLGVLGAFYVARQIVTAPSALLSQAFRQVVFAYGAQLDDGAQLRERVNRAIALLVEVLAPALAFGIVWLEPIIRVALGDHWPNLSDFAWWIMFVAAMFLLAGWLDRVLDVLGRQQVGVVLQVGSDLVLVGVALSGPRFGLDAVGLVAALSIVGTLTNIVWLIVVLRLLGSMWHEIGSFILRLVSRTTVLTLIHSAIFVSSSGLIGMATGTIVLAVSLLPVIKRSFDLLRPPVSPQPAADIIS